MEIFSFSAAEEEQVLMYFLATKNLNVPVTTELLTAETAFCGTADPSWIAKCSFPLGKSAVDV